MISRFDTILERDRRKDRIAVSISLVSVAVLTQSKYDESKVIRIEVTCSKHRVTRNLAIANRSRVSCANKVTTVNFQQDPIIVA